MQAQKILIFAALTLLLPMTSWAASDIWYSPLTFGVPDDTGTGPGPSPLVIRTGVAEQAIKITSTVRVLETHHARYVHLGLSVPAGHVFRGIEVCYDVDAAVSRRTYISQIRLSMMTTPDLSSVVHDDATDLTSLTPTCYRSAPTLGLGAIEGAITLGLKIIIGKIEDSIKIGGIRLFLD